VTAPMTFTLVGHRGAMGLEPENTLRSFRRAVALGADAVELDLRVSRDGHLVILHDADVDRTTDGDGPVSEMSLAELRQLDAGLGERIPTFTEVLDEIELPIQAEIKSPKAGRLALDLIRERELLGRITVTSFSPEIIADVLSYEPKTRTGLITSRADGDFLARALELGTSLVCVGLDNLDREFVDRCHRDGLEVIGWPVNDVGRLLHVLRAGADGITSDVPSLLADASSQNAEVAELLEARRARSEEH